MGSRFVYVCIFSVQCLYESGKFFDSSLLSKEEFNPKETNAEKTEYACIIKKGHSGP